MAKSARPQPKKTYATAYIREWLDFFKVKPVELVKAGIINEGYLSQLRSGKKTNPSPAKLVEIGNYLRIEWTDLYRPPPTRQVTQEIGGLQPATLDRIRRQLSS